MTKTFSVGICITSFRCLSCHTYGESEMFNFEKLCSIGCRISVFRVNSVWEGFGWGGVCFNREVYI